MGNGERLPRFRHRPALRALGFLGPRPPPAGPSSSRSAIASQQIQQRFTLRPEQAARRRSCAPCAGDSASLDLTV